ncbi:hypothetical protein AAG906_039262 [Vitis piasezkii]
MGGATVEIEMGSLRVALEQADSEVDWARARFDRLNLLDERRLRAAPRSCISTKMARFQKRVKPRPLRIVDPEGAIWLMDLDGNRFSSRLMWITKEVLFHHMENSHIISATYLADTGLEILSLRRSSLCLFVIDIIFGVHLFMFRVHGSWDSLYMLHFIYEGMSFDHWVFEPSFLSFLSPYHLGLRYVPCLKTTLRPWDQMSSLTASTWTVFEIWLIFRYRLIQLCSDYRDREFDDD